LLSNWIQYNLVFSQATKGLLRLNKEFIMKKPLKKLKLNRETLHHLDGSRLRDVLGGNEAPTIPKSQCEGTCGGSNCGGTCLSCTCPAETA
jgi:natural product precursor